MSYYLSNLKYINSKPSIKIFVTSFYDKRVFFFFFCRTNLLFFKLNIYFMIYFTFIIIVNNKIK